MAKADAIYVERTVCISKTNQLIFFTPGEVFVQRLKEERRVTRLNRNVHLCPTTSTSGVSECFL